MKTVIVEEGQNIMDIAIQEYGKADAFVDVCDDNNLEYDAVLTPGQVLNIKDTSVNEDVDFKNYLKQKNITVVSRTEL